MKSFAEWIKEGESLFAAATAEFESLRAQIAELEQQLAAKAAEINQMASVLHKPSVSAPAHHDPMAGGELVATPIRVTSETLPLDSQPVPVTVQNSATAAIARALTGGRR